MPNKIEEILEKIATSEGFELLNWSSLAGGSINQVFLLETSAEKMVVKLNEADRFPGMFDAEKEGLECLKNTRSIDVPEVFSYGRINSSAYLLLEFKPEGKKHPRFWEIFAEKLATLHKNTASYFGFSNSNYIGSLPQYNDKMSSGAEFYISQRLEPQFKMASKNGFAFENLDRLFKIISEEIPQEKPSLIHGDLWGGNYLVNKKGLPCLIDPATCYACREMDLAMMKLFGGFPEQVFTKYNQIFPLVPQFEKRIPFWQLYYLLVHLNIFGRSYLPQVKECMQEYF